MAKNRIVHTQEEILRIRRAAEVTADVRDNISRLAKPGMSTYDLDQLSGQLIRETGGLSAFKDYCGYPGYICISVNDVVIHGIGTPTQILKESDIVSIDVGVQLNNALGDTALTFGMGAISLEHQRLLDGTKEALAAGIAAAKCGNYVADISQAVEHVAKSYHLGIVRDYVGHGCGIKLHEPPEVPNFTGWGRGPQLEPGMVICIEPMLTLGSSRVTVDRNDGWTVRTRDGSWSAHFEHTILITEKEPEILTWPKMM